MSSAQAVGVSSRQLHKLMKKYGLRKEAFKAPININNPFRTLSSDTAKKPELQIHTIEFSIISICCIMLGTFMTRLMPLPFY